ncbi:MAG: B12-binding domain-containing radical SAM protein [Planctomycetes bacterium]|nr:B12-binding domain-containing radical SAM protein [Planctomycetota bacterium]
MKILLQSTKKNVNPDEREFYEMDLVLEYLGLGRALLDLSMPTIAACTPAGVDVEIGDEYLAPIDFQTDADLIGFSAKTSCVTHAYEASDRLRAAGKKTVLGGIHATVAPDEAALHFDSVVLGEAEDVWPKLVADFTRGEMKSRYEAVGFPDMAKIPDPAWHLMDSDRYLFDMIQTTRGCPFKCKFCSVPDVSGQTFRFKPVENVVREIRSLPKSKTMRGRNRPLYVVDDNFISNRNYTKDLLRALVPLFQSGELHAWSAETSLNVAKDDELLDLLAASGCDALIIGFESVQKETLLEMDKKVNTCIPYKDAVQKIYDRGISIVGNFIVGFDTDTKRVFHDTAAFIQDHRILYPFLSILTPMPGTGLHREMKQAGRLFHEDWSRYDTRHVVFQPKNLTPDELMDGYVWLYKTLYSAEATADRLSYWWREKSRSRDSAIMRWLYLLRSSPFYLRGDSGLREFYRKTSRLLFGGDAKPTLGPLLTCLDGYDFAQSLGKHESADAAAHWSEFADPDRHAACDDPTEYRGGCPPAPHRKRHAVV